MPGPPVPYKFKIDENRPRELAETLASAGHDALTIEDQGLSGRDDETISEVCRVEGRTVVTFDLGFADLRRHPSGDGPGTIILRLRRQDTPTVLNTAASLIALLATEPLHGRLWIVEESGVRIRGAD